MMHVSQSLMLRTTLFAATLPLLALIYPPALEASECKGLSQEACAANPECRWMEGYTRKDGVQVSSHCRLAKPRKDNATETAAPTDTKAAPEEADTTPETVTPEAKPATQ